jgi:peptide/nickel transport system ATP-binding protein
MRAILEVENLNLSLAVPGGILRAIRGLSLKVEAGETLCIVGESGSGKSLTALSLMGLLPKTAVLKSNRMHFMGHDLARLSDREFANLRGDRISMIFQEPMTSLNPCYTIGNQLMEVYLRHKNGGTARARDRAAEMLNEVGIANPETRMIQYPHQLSGGLRQRVMIAMALICEPDLIIADEPTTALDVTIQLQVLSLLDSLRKKHGTAMIFITHDLGVVAQIATRAAVMYAGQIIETAPIEQLFKSPAHPYTRGLIDCIPAPGKTNRNQPLKTIPGEVPDLTRDLSGCAFRSRCSKAGDVCFGEIDNSEIAANHFCQCIFPES